MYYHMVLKFHHFVNHGESGLKFDWDLRIESIVSQLFLDTYNIPLKKLKLMFQNLTNVQNNNYNQILTFNLHNECGTNILVF